jgi:long-chain acyl-CoA synthetase
VQIADCRFGRAEYICILPKATEYGLDKVHFFNSGGGPCPVDVIARRDQRFGRTLNEGYGLSETSPVTHTTAQLARKPGSIGLALPGMHMKIAHCKTSLAPSKVPCEVEVRDTPPMSAVGKILYRVLRDERDAASS